MSFSTKKKPSHTRCVDSTKNRGFRFGDDQANHTDDPPQCGGGGVALTWGVIGPQAMVWAEAAGHHDQPKM
jgi:hypothetical protein